MPIVAFPGLAPAVPEIALVCAAMALLIIGVLRGEGSSKLVSWLSVAVLIATLVIAGLLGGERQIGFYGMFINDAFAVFMKALVLLGSAVTIIMGLRYNEEHQIARFEFPVLVLLATAGMMVMISANDLITLYLGLELQSLALYVVASFDRDSVRSTEAGLKYFVLGALASGMLLYGASLVYGFTGTTSFANIAGLFGGGAKPSAGLIIGMVFVSVGLAFKCSAVPFHMWTPDVYEGAPTPVTAFFSVAPKIAAVALFVRFLIEPLGGLLAEWRQIIVFLSVASMILGAVAAIAQTNIKRLMAYSSIGHVGYALIGLAAATPNGIRGVLVYMAIYLFMNIGTWAVILCMRQRGQMLEGISDLSGIGRTNDEARRLAREGAPEGTLVWADAQEAGRGRRGRPWLSPPGNLYLSLLLRPDAPASRAPQLGFVTALALADALRLLAGTGLALSLKWPNDVLAGRAKLAGILLESEMAAGGGLDFVIIGVGVNLTSAPRDLEYPAASLSDQGFPGITPASLLESFAEHFALWLECWRAEGFVPVRAAWLNRAGGIGEAVRVRLETLTLEGRFLDLDQDGALVIEPGGDRRRIAAGEGSPG